MRIAVFLFSLLLALPVCAENFTVSAAISLKESLTQIGADYQKKTGDHITYNFDASAESIRTRMLSMSWISLSSFINLS